VEEGSLQLVLDAKAELGEGPCWDAANKLLYWIDILGQNVHIYNPQLQSDRVIHVGMYVGCVAVAASGGLIMAADRAFYSLDPVTEQITLVSGLPNEPQGNRFNDGKCDPAGRFWAGTMPMNGSEAAGSLYRLDAESGVKHIFGSVRCSNGIAWSPDGSTMYYIDSPTKQVAAFDYDLQTGNIQNRRVAVTIPEGEGVPDGMTIDQEGNLWIAQWGGWKVSRWDPRDGTQLDTVPVPAEQVTSCAFGGVNMDELYITTARTGLDEEQLMKQPKAGGLFKVKTTVKGIGNTLFSRS